MPRKSPIYSLDFFDDPLTEDVEELLARFQQTDSVRFEDFSAIWREMGLSNVYVGITYMSEQKRFTRITLATAMKYFLPPYSYQIRAGGLYLMFGFYHTQLAVPRVKIRLALRDWELIQKFLKDSVNAGHLDIVYIYQKLVAAKAIHFTAMQHFLSYRKQKGRKQQFVCAQFLGRCTAVQDLISSEIMEELSNTQSHYEKLKAATAEVSPKVTMTTQDLVAHLKETMTGFITWQQKTFSKDKKNKNSDDDDDDDDDKEEKLTEAEWSSTRAKLLSSIKTKSYKNVTEASKSRRHRQTETVDSTSSGAEQVQEPSRRRKRPPSLRARTWKSFGVMQEETAVQTWLLSVPEQQEKLPMKRVNPIPPSRP